MEGGQMMVLHAIIIGLFSYLFMICILKQEAIIAQNRGLLIASVILIYMILFRQCTPILLNKNL